MSSAASLGTVYGSVRLDLSQLDADASLADGMFASLRDQINEALAGIEPLSDLDAPIEDFVSTAEDALSSIPLAAEDAFSTLTDTVTSAMSDATTAVEDGGSQMDDAASASADEQGTIWDSLASMIGDFGAQVSSIVSTIGDQFAQLAASADDMASGMGGAMDAAGAAMDGMAARAAGAGEGLGGMFSRLPFGIGSFGGLLTSMLAFQAIGGATQAVTSFGGSLIGMNSTMESLHQQLTSITGSSGAADKILAWVKQFGQEVPDTTEHLAQATVTIQSLGLNAMQVMPSIANVAAAMGVDLPTAAKAFSDAYEGRFMMMQMELHVTKSQLQDFGLQLDKHGKVLNNSLLPAFEKLSQSKFGGAINNQMQTLGGQLSNMTDRVQFFAMALGAPLFAAFKDALSGVFSFLDSHKAQLDGFTKSVGGGLAGAFKSVQGAIQALPGILGQLTSGFHQAFSGKQGEERLKALEGAGRGVMDVLRTLGSWISANFGPALIHLAQGAGTVAGKLADFIGFIQTHQAAMDGFKIALMAIGVYIATFLIDALVGMAIAAWSAVVPIIAAELPIIAVIAAIALLAFGIYELVTHWKQISAWLEGVWNVIVAGVVAGFHWLTAEAEGLWSSIVARFDAGINFIKGLVQAGLQFILWEFMLPIHAIVDLFDWLYQHNTYFQELVDAIRKITAKGLAWLRTTWEDITGWLVGTWTKLRNQVEADFEYVRAIIEAKILAVKTRLENIWNDIVGRVDATNARIKGMIVGVWDDVMGYITGLGKRADSAIQTGIVQPFLKPMMSMVSDAESWGQNLINNFIKGIQNMAGKVGDEAKNVAGNIAKYLGFHSPAEEGPGSDADTWAPNLMNMYAGGIQAGTPAVASAASGAASALRGGLTGDITTLNVAGGAGTAAGGAFGGDDSSAGVVNHNETLNLTLEVDSDDGSSDDGSGGDDAATQGQNFGVSAGTALLQALSQRGHTA